MLHSLQSSTRCPRVRVAVNMQETVFIVARFKTSYHQELVSHPMPKHIEAASLVTKYLQQPFPDSFITM